MRVQVLYFALLRERLRKSQELLELPVGSTAGDLLELLCAHHEAVAGVRSSLRVAVNQAFVPLSHVLADWDEVALIPPVSGGAPLCRLSYGPIGLDEVVTAVSGPSQGGVVTFTGTVRNHSRGKAVLHLEYEAYEPMALRTLENILVAIEAARPGVRLAVVHRLGTLAVGETAVVVAASAPHRTDAFVACQEVIDRLKQHVPIWKKEVAEDGEAWIGDRP